MLSYLLAMKFSRKKQKILQKILISLASVLVLFAAYNIAFAGRIFPGISVAGIYLGGKTPEEAQNSLEESLVPPSKLTLSANGQNFDIETGSFDFSYNAGESARAAYNLDRTGNILADFYSRSLGFFRHVKLGARINLNEDKLNSQISVLAGQVTVDPIYPTAKLVGENVVIDNGKKGTNLDNQLLRVEIGQNLAFAKISSINVPIVEVDPSLDSEQTNKFKERAQNLLGKTLNLNFEFQKFSFSSEELFKFLNPQGKYSTSVIETEEEAIAKSVNREPQNSVFIFQSGRVQEFKPSKDGAKVDISALEARVIGNLQTLESTDAKTASIDIPVVTTPPEIKTGDINNLGIKELIGRGSSLFFHSIPGRIHNIVLASSRFNGVLVKPGDTFSFNDVLGDVSAYTGYQQAYIIKDGKTVLGDGGGVCQVSTTLFRAMLNAGLPVVERAAHAYRVGYYEQDSPPGLDATVYSPSPDLKFKNDTPGYILIQTSVDLNTINLVFELYGTKDGRVATVTKPIITNQSPPPPDLYQDDPTLPTGTVKQVDFAAWGATVTFNYSVERGGETIYQKTFVSNFRPWQAVYLRGTGPAK